MRTAFSILPLCPLEQNLRTDPGGPCRQHQLRLFSPTTANHPHRIRGRWVMRRHTDNTRHTSSHKSLLVLSLAFFLSRYYSSVAQQHLQTGEHAGLEPGEGVVYVHQTILQYCGLGLRQWQHGYSGMSSSGSLPCKNKQREEQSEPTCPFCLSSNPSFPQLGREEPAMSMDSSGKVLLARGCELQQANLKTIGEAEVRDGEKLLLGVKDMGSSEIHPQTMQHSPNGR